jgi:hypothetical protein
VSRLIAVMFVLLVAAALRLPALAAEETTPATGAPTPAPSATATPTPAETPAAAPSPVKKAPRNAIRIYRVTYDEPHSRPGLFFRWGGRSNWAIGSGFERATGAVWFDNTTNETLTDVRMTIRMYSTRFGRTSDAREYFVGTLDPRRSMSWNYSLDVLAQERVVPSVEITYRVPGDPDLQRVEARPWGY